MSGGKANSEKRGRVGRVEERMREVWKEGGKPGKEGKYEKFMKGRKGGREKCVEGRESYGGRGKGRDR